MSESYRTLENSTSELFEKLRDEKANFHISKKINLSNPLHLNNRIDMTADVAIVNQEIDVNVPQYEHVSPSECIDDAVESHADSFAIGDTCDIEDDAERKFADGSTKTRKRKKVAHLIKRSCPKCKTLVTDASVSTKRSCANCETPLSYQCARCDKQFNSYHGCCSHLSVKCNTQILDLKCPKCDYRTHATHLMNVHQSDCFSGINFICDLCAYTTRFRSDLHRHITNRHKDILKVDCPQCKTKPNTCERCKKKVSICKCCHKGFSSTDSFQEHQKSCKPPVLKCKYCPYQTIDNSKLKKHMKLELMNGSMPRDLPAQD